jgi:drug/metabolite transporter (DMT)-like permease
MKQGTLKADILLLITATIWGFAFVAQRVGMDYVGPFAHLVTAKTTAKIQ